MKKIRLRREDTFFVLNEESLSDGAQDLAKTGHMLSFSGLLDARSFPRFCFLLKPERAR